MTAVFNTCNNSFLGVGDQHVYFRWLRSQDLSQQQLDDLEPGLARDSVLPILRMLIRQGVSDRDIGI